MFKQTKALLESEPTRPETGTQYLKDLVSYAIFTMSVVGYVFAIAS